MVDRRFSKQDLVNPPETANSGSVKHQNLSTSLVVAMDSDGKIRIPVIDNLMGRGNLETPSVLLTGSRSKCVSDVETYDMVGNVIEFVAVGSA